MSQTIKDVISLAEKIGIRYIWVDSLCILQDSLSDWEEESAKISAYYSQSYLTIGAGMSHDGLFTEERLPTVEYCKLKIRPDNSMEQTSNLYFSATRHEMPLRKIGGSDQSLLYSRGWTMQEEILSPRFLSFEPTQVYFRCATHVDYECGYRMPVNRWKTLGERHLLSKDDWVHIAENFSQRTLTVASDALPALSGLALAYQNIWNDKYLAGVWRKDLWRHLLWYVSQLTPTRPVVYRGPSWSWISTDAKISYVGSKFGEPLMTLLAASTKPKG